MTKEFFIEYNKKHGLLCACNKVRVPYGPPPSKLEANGVIHGYNHCEILPKH